MIVYSGAFRDAKEKESSVAGSSLASANTRDSR